MGALYCRVTPLRHPLFPQNYRQLIFHQKREIPHSPGRKKIGRREFSHRAFRLLIAKEL
jgi:hypothetical protein